MILGLFAEPGTPRRTASKRIGLFCILLLFGLFQISASLGLRINTSPSLPVGLYVITADPGSELVEFCPPEPYARLAIIRGYREAGNCPDGAAPLLKPVVAKTGDVVEASPQGLMINGHRLPNTVPVPADTKGRLLNPWPFGRYQVRPEMVWVASSYHPRSFDSRYFGPIATSAIRDHVRPLMTGGK